MHCGNVAFHVLDNGGDQAVFHVNLRLLVRFLLQFFLDVLLQVRQGVKLADILCKLVVQSRQLLLLDRVYLYLEDNRLAFQILCMVIFREGNVDRRTPRRALWPTTCSSKPGMN